MECSYWYRACADEHGILKLREFVTFLLVCRACENPSCETACPVDALERQDDGTMKRYNLRCISCKSCCQACPFGVIYQDTVPFYDKQCDYCLRAGITEPSCVASCAQDAIHFCEVEEDPDENIYVVNDSLAVRAPKWEKQAV